MKIFRGDVDENTEASFKVWLGFTEYGCIWIGGESLGYGVCEPVNCPDFPTIHDSASYIVDKSWDISTDIRDEILEETNIDLPTVLKTALAILIFAVIVVVTIKPPVGVPV